MRLRARVDENQKRIVDMFRGLGWSVAHTHTLGKGFPDLVVGFAGKNYLIEVKDGSKPPSARKLTADELAFQSAWRGQYDVISDEIEVIEFCKRKFRGE